jgi:hypothetical protein
MSRIAFDAIEDSMLVKKLVQTCFSMAGYEIRRRPDLCRDSGDISDECLQMIRKVRHHTMVASEGLMSLYDQVLFCERHGIPGDLVECGVWKGGSVGLMAMVNMAHAPARRHIHLFDSFEEICEPDEAVDGERAIREVRMWSRSGGTKGKLVPLKGIYDHRGGPGTIPENRDLLEATIGYDANYLHFHKGWFQETLPEVHNDIKSIAVLRIDGDWYASTMVCLQYLFDKVVSGGFVIIDDYGAYEGCRKAVDAFIADHPRPLFLNRVNQDIRYIVVP